jgi:hypothetical protein
MRLNRGGQPKAGAQVDWPQVKHIYIKRLKIMWMRSSWVYGWDLTEWLERLTANAEVATGLGSIPTSSDTVESEWRQMKECWIQYIERKKIPKNPPVKIPPQLWGCCHRCLKLKTSAATWQLLCLVSWCCPRGVLFSSAHPQASPSCSQVLLHFWLSPWYLYRLVRETNMLAHLFSFRHLINSICISWLPYFLSLVISWSCNVNLSPTDVSLKGKRSLGFTPILSQKKLWNWFHVEKVPVIKLNFPGLFTDIWSQCVYVKYSW